MTDISTEYRQLALDLGKFLDEKKASDILILDTSKISQFADLFVILTGQSLLQLHALQTQTADFLQQRGFQKRNPQNAYLDSPWVLLDFGDIVIHLFLPEAREFYHLEKLWFDAPVLFPKGDS